MSRTLPFKCESRSVGCLCIITCRNHCISMPLLKTCTWCRSTACALQLWWKICGRLEWLVGLTRSNSRSYCLVVMFNVKITATGCHTTAMKAFCCLQREHAKNLAPLVAFGSWLWSSWRRSRIMKLAEAIRKIRKNRSRWEVARARRCTSIVAK